MRPLPIIALAVIGACSGTEPSPNDPSDVTPRVCTGFANTPDVWPVGAPVVADFFTYSSDGLGQYWSVVDLTADGIPDLIQHAHGNNADAEKMGAAWYVWPGTGSGFGNRVEWTLPIDHRELDGIHAANSIQTVLDIDGDGAADLIRARDPEGGDVFGGDTNPHWEVYLGDGATGFATTATEWTFPALRTPNEVYEGGTHTVRDIDGDGMVELVLTRDSDNFGGADNPHWRVHEVDGTGFSDDYREWALPPRRTLTTDYGNWVNTAQRWHSTQDVTGDGLPDLVVPRSSTFPYAVYGEEGDWQWRVHPNTGDGVRVGAARMVDPRPHVCDRQRVGRCGLPHVRRVAHDVHRRRRPGAGDRSRSGDGRALRGGWRDRLGDLRCRGPGLHR